MVRKAALIGVLLAIATPGYAGEDAYITASGNDLLDHCVDGRSLEERVACMNYFQGVVNGATMAGVIGNNSRVFCPPSGADNRQLLSVTRRYLENFPEYRHFPATTLIVKSLERAFPCPPRP